MSFCLDLSCEKFSVANHCSAARERSRRLVGAWAGSRRGVIGIFKNHFQAEVEEILKQQKK